MSKEDRLKAKEYFNNNYGIGHIRSVAEMKDFISLYALMDDFAQSYHEAQLKKKVPDNSFHHAISTLNLRQRELEKYIETEINVLILNDLNNEIDEIKQAQQLLKR